MTRLSSNGYPNVWQNCTVSCKESDQSTMVDFHRHVYYEVSLILSGDVKSMLGDRSVEGTQSRLVLTAPQTPHWMCLASPSRYSRINLCFSEEFLADYVPEWRSLVQVFGNKGRILLLSDEQREFCRECLLAIQAEKSLFRQRLRILAFLSHVAELDQPTASTPIERPPSYIVEALTYIGEHYSERIVAQALAWRLGVGRTTLMITFRKHTGSTLAEYITHVRVRAAIALLAQGVSQECAAEQVGFGSGGALIRAFRHCYGMTPRQYMRSKGE